MNLKIKNYSKSKLIIIAASASLLIIACITGAFLLHGNSQAQADTKVKAVTKLFSFTGADGWRKGPSNATSMALFGEAAAEKTSSCFTSVEYKSGIVDVAALVQESFDSLASGGYEVTSLGAQTVTMQTATGEMRYELHQSSVVSPSGAMEVMGGNEIGFLQLSDGYVKIIGNCNTAEELTSTIPALEAIKVSQVK